MKGLTEKQKRVYEFLLSYLRQYGYPPTVREIGTYFGFLWPAARGHLRSLERKGFIRLKPSRSRGIEIPGFRSSKGMEVPVAGRIQAGRSILAVEDRVASILVDRGLFPAEGAFALKVSGDSMKDAGIFEGDYVVVKPQGAVENGGIGVVLVGDEAMVKRVFVDGDRVVLKPENSAVEPASYGIGSVEVIGRVMGVIRTL